MQGLAGAGTKRSLESPDNSSNQKKARPQTPAEKLAHLTSLIRHSDPRPLLDLLKAIANGDVSHANFPNRQGAPFGDMLCKGDFALFVAAFNMYREARSTAALQAGGPPSEGTLTLTPPSHWDPSMVELEEALQQVQVDRLIVLLPDTVDTAFHSMSAAVVLCVTTLLHAGAGALYIEGAFIDYDAIASAVATSRLRDMAFGSRPTPSLSACDEEGYQKIVEALARCVTLRKVGLGRPEHLAWHPIIGNFQKNGGPSLDTVELFVQGRALDQEWDRAPRYTQHIAAFMDMVGKIPTLTTCNFFGIQVRDIDFLERSILAPLAQTRSLTRLSIQCDLTKASPLTIVLSAPKLIAFKSRCPSLLHLSCAATTTLRSDGETAGSFMDKLLRLGASLNPADVMTAFADALSPSKFSLHSLRMCGFHLAAECCNMLFDAIANHPWLLHLELEQCAIHLPSAPRLTAALAHNDRINTVLLPQRLHGYYMVIQTTEGAVAAGFPNIDVHSLATSGLTIRTYRQLPAHYLDVVTRLLPSLSADAQKLFEMAGSKSLEKQRHAQRPIAQNPPGEEPRTPVTEGIEDYLQDDDTQNV